MLFTILHKRVFYILNIELFSWIEIGISFQNHTVTRVTENQLEYYRINL